MNSLIMTLCLLLISMPTLAERGVFVGNGGDGYMFQSNVYLTDLLEAGLESIEISEQIAENSQITKLLSLAQFPFAVNHLLLAKKIAQIDRAVPGAGQMMARALAMYHWVGLRVPLKKLPDLEGRTISLPDSDRVQIAVRLGADIRIDLNLWDKLPKTHQIALLLHEVIFSMMPFEKIEYYDGRPSVTMQSARKTREIVGHMMANEIRAESLAKLMNSYLAAKEIFFWANLLSAPQDQELNLHIKFNFQDENLPKSPTTTIERQYLLTPNTLADDLNAVLWQTCSATDQTLIGYQIDMSAVVILTKWSQGEDSEFGTQLRLELYRPFPMYSDLAKILSRTQADPCLAPVQSISSELKKIWNLDYEGCQIPDRTELIQINDPFRLVGSNTLKPGWAWYRSSYQGLSVFIDCELNKTGATDEYASLCSSNCYFEATYDCRQRLKKVQIQNRPNCQRIMSSHVFGDFNKLKACQIKNIDFLGASCQDRRLALGCENGCHWKNTKTLALRCQYPDEIEKGIQYSGSCVNPSEEHHFEQASGASGGCSSGTIVRVLTTQECVKN